MVARKLCVVPGRAGGLARCPEGARHTRQLATWRSTGWWGVKFLSGRVAPWQFREGRRTFSLNPPAG